ncbi:ParB/RepB/Spo0J family partition protein [Govanella unica]|uniref:ParB/RepB/Spo0J family partition protein n=1 Tax=Govanella unica TaxID=2975056 RepID=A0A9X3Z6Z2_9PROT|nr:ParB/RepB/Spo0J family partition protein [Govania unica]MDA5193695.1 ParB/RepB/Spo0J family partition protein [Govania unica]
MKLAHISLDQLVISKANMRHGKRPPDIADLLPSVRARGVLVPLLVRKSGDGDDNESYEIVAGRRRYFAARAVAAEGQEVDPLPCAIMEAGDDATALEASLLENIARLDPDEVSQWEVFTRLIREGRTVEDIAATFGLNALTVRRRLALGNLLPGIRAAYRKGEIDAASLRHLTMASKARQRDWLALENDPEARAPRGSQLKSWLFGGQAIAVTAALFPLELYTGELLSDLFGEECYFADGELFWRLQNEAIGQKRAAYVEAGWRDAVLLGPDQPFAPWDHEKTAKRRGGKVYLSVSRRGELEIHEGYLTRKEARCIRTKEGEGGTDDSKSARPEVSCNLQTYLDLHRHAALRLALQDHPGVALRLLLAHVIAGSFLWAVRPEPQRASPAIAESLAASPAEAAFAEKRHAVLALLGLAPDEPMVTHSLRGADGTVTIFARLLSLAEDDVLRILAVVMGETLEAGSAMVEAAAYRIGLDMRRFWQPDEAFFDLLRDREIVTALLAEVAGPAVAASNRQEKLRTQKQILRDCLAGDNGRLKSAPWLPGWMAVPARAVTERGGVKAVDHWARIGALFAEADNHSLAAE